MTNFIHIFQAYIITSLWKTLLRVAEQNEEWEIGISYQIWIPKYNLKTIQHNKKSFAINLCHFAQMHII